MRSGTVSYSPDNVSGGLNVELQGSYFGAAAVGLDEQGNSFTSFGGGVGAGASASAYYVLFAPHPKGPHRPNTNNGLNSNVGSRNQKRPSQNNGLSW